MGAGTGMGFNVHDAAPIPLALGHPVPTSPLKGEEPICLASPEPAWHKASPWILAPGNAQHGEAGAQPVAEDEFDVAH